MPTASLLLRRDMPERWSAFQRGLQAVGFKVTPEPLSHPTPDDIVITWNRHRNVVEAKRFEQAGGRAVIVENGWLNTGAGVKTFAICLSHHNGAGSWFQGPEDRWSKLGIELKPWRADGDHILVLDQRGIGENGVAMPRQWCQDAVGRLRGKTKRPIHIRRHPGNVDSDPNWENCWAAFTWSSGAGIKAIVNGIPCFHELTNWIGAPAARLGIQDVEDPFTGDRLPALQRLCWAQWARDEIETGEAFEGLLTLRPTQGAMV